MDDSRSPVTYHCAIAIDIDRFSDAKLERDWLPLFRDNALASTVAELRALCARAREAGQVVFAPCEHTHPDGRCAGHARGPESGIFPLGED